MNLKDMRAAMQRQLDADDPAGEAERQGIPASIVAVTQGRAFRAARSSVNSRPKLATPRSRANAAKRRTCTSAAEHDLSESETLETNDARLQPTRF